MLVEKSPSKSITSIYRKPTFTGQYLRWNSFSPQKRKTNQILFVTQRALAICSKRLPSKLDKIKFILHTNGYPDHVIMSFMAKKMKHFRAVPRFGPKDAPSIPWLGSVSTRFEKQVKSAVKQCFCVVEPRIVALPTSFSPLPTRMYCLLSTKKQRDLSILTPLRQLVCVGRTCQRLQNRIKQDVPKSIRSCSSSQKRILRARQCKSSTQPNIQSRASDSALDFIFYKILPVLNSMMTADRFSTLACSCSHFHQNF